jgi:hypothetical protein
VRTLFLDTGARRSSQGQQQLDLRTSIAAAEARLTACAPCSESQQQPGSGARAAGSSPAAAAALQLNENGAAEADADQYGRLAAGQLAAEEPQPVPSEPTGESTPRCNTYRPRQVHFRTALFMEAVIL